jgi:hypothetical protein
MRQRSWLLAFLGHGIVFDGGRDMDRVNGTAGYCKRIPVQLLTKHVGLDSNEKNARKTGPLLEGGEGKWIRRG